MKLELQNILIISLYMEHMDLKSAIIRSKKKLADVEQQQYVKFITIINQP